MVWTYVVPTHALEPLAVQLPASRRHEFLERARIEIHAELTRRLARGEGPGTVPTGLLSADIVSAATPSQLVFAGELSPGQISRRPPRGRIGRDSLPWRPEASGREWVYPGAAAGGLFRDAVDMLRARGHVLIGELLRR